MSNTATPYTAAASTRADPDPPAFRARIPGRVARAAPTAASRPSLALASTSPSSDGAYARVSPFLVMPCTFDSTSRMNASGNRRRSVACDAAIAATSILPAEAANEMARRNPPRSSSGTNRGAATASGAMVRPRYRATWTLASSGFSAKNTESARAMATSVSPAALAMWTSEYASSGSVEFHLFRSGRVVHSSKRRARKRRLAPTPSARCPSGGRGSPAMEVSSG